MIGRKIGRYRIVSRLGAGGMATVWEARDELLGHTVALKVLAESLAGSPEARARFRHEGQVSAMLEHPGIARVYEAGEDQGLTYLAMALVDGETLDERIGRALLPAGEAIRIATEVAEALDYAHARGIVHRDVTPRNVMLARDGRVLVLDFGLALAEGLTRLSSSHTMVGTTAFVAPEVLLGRDADARSDLYSLGVVFFLSLTGALPFQGDRSEVLNYAALHQPMRRATELRPDLPPEVNEVLDRLLARDPERRYASGAAVAADLRCLAAGRGTAASHVANPVVDGRVAEAIARSDATLYLAVAPVEDRSTDEVTDPARGEFCRSLAASLPAHVASARRVHVVPFVAGPGEASEDALREAAARCGANVLLLTNLRANAEEARVTFEVVDVARGVRVGGGVAIGSLRDPFALEDAVSLRVRAALGLGPRLAGVGVRAPAHDPGAPERYAQALRYLRRSDLEASVDGAIGLLERLGASDSPVAEYDAMLARAFVAKHAITREHVWLTRAAEALDRAAALGTDAPELALARGDLFVASGQHEAALREYERALGSRASWVEAWHGTSRALEALGRSAGAEAACARAIESEPDDWRGHQRLAVVLTKRGDYARALESCRRVTELVPDNAKGFQNLGSALFHMDRHGDSIRAYERSLELRPSPHAYTSLGTVLYFLDRTDEACEACERAVALNSADPVMWGNLGEVCVVDPARTGRGVEALTRAVGLMRARLERQGATAEDEARYAGWLASLGDADGARAAAGRALARDSGDVHCMVAAAMAYVQIGDRAACLDCLEHAVRAGYGTRMLERSPKLRPLHGDPEFQRILRLGGTTTEAVPEVPKGQGGA